ncbi:conserved hypothetical protein [Mesorhizobium sp. STM 4661]|nr:conserved hypothetical protein [Mesorhizobium sp. STM 4661]
MTEVAGKTVQPHAIAPIEFILATPLNESFYGLRDDRGFCGRGIAAEVVQLLAQFRFEQKLVTNAVGLHALVPTGRRWRAGGGTSIIEMPKIAYGRYLR